VLAPALALRPQARPGDRHTLADHAEQFGDVGIAGSVCGSENSTV